jgi:SAM-dependent methyltransferase
VNTIDTIELQRIVTEYRRRAQDAEYRDRTHALLPERVQALQALERALYGLLRRQGFANLVDRSLLDIGCGEGHLIAKFIGLGVHPGQCAGVDLLDFRVELARQRLPSQVRLHAGDASSLPFAPSSFDLITQFTVFSSILDATLRARVAREMLRMLRPGGMIIWYDFWVNPRNPQTRGVRLPEIRSYFPGCHIDARLVSFLPPVQARIARVSRLVADLIEYVPLKTHWLVGIVKPNETAS